MVENTIHEPLLALEHIIALLLILNSAASLLIFAQFGMRPLEKKLRALHKDTVSQWDGPGWRIFTYAIKLSVPATFWGKKGEYKMFLDPFLLHQIASRRDKFLARWLMASALLFVVYSVIYVEFL
ncbi:MAG: hypothetical protein JJU14_14865 [Alkalimonas sp.]|nr:hypothetical protein [Alkalimonas sp.]